MGLTDKDARLRQLGRIRQQTRWPGYSGIGDYHNGAYECDWVSPYTKTAGNVDAAVMVLLQDWASDEWCKGPFDQETADLGYTPSEPTSRNLVRLLQDTFGLSRLLLLFPRSPSSSRGWSSAWALSRSPP